MAQPKYNFHPCRIHHVLRTRPMCSRTFPRVLAAVMLAGASSLALTAGWPEKSVRVIVAYPPGGVSDAVTRAISEKLGERMGASFFVEYPGGAGGTIGMGEMARAEIGREHV